MCINQAGSKNKSNYRKFSGLTCDLCMPHASRPLADAGQKLCAEGASVAYHEPTVRLGVCNLISKSSIGPPKILLREVAS